MRTLKKLVSFMFSRLFMVVLMLLVQILLIAAVVVVFSQTGLYAYLFLNLISFLVVLGIVSNNDNPSYKITWIIFILMLPVTGGVFYLMLGNKRLSDYLLDQSRAAVEATRDSMQANNLCDSALAELSGQLALQGRYIYNMSGNPVYRECVSRFYPLGELMFDEMLAEMEQARRYIFMEFFIVAPGVMWDRLYALLRRKMAEGVEVWFMYDDVGTIRTLPKGFDQMVRESGMRLCVFNPFRPRISVILNNRDHRKLVVIDGETAFCGGINIADEYINAIEKYGHWKDTGVMVKGPAVWGFAHMFLQQWQFGRSGEIDFNRYRPLPEADFPQGEGLLQVFGDTPLDRVNVTETAYLNIISRATGYVYITSPYLVIDYEMESALCAAAESGVDVRIIVPHKYDKWYVHVLTQSHYAKLLGSGVRVFEYTPGFIHGKTFVSDDIVSMVGTCNMDFRSFYLHFECSAAFYGSQTVAAVKEDFLTCQETCRELTLEESLDITFRTRVLRALLKVFAPLL